MFACSRPSFRAWGEGEPASSETASWDAVGLCDSYGRLRRRLSRCRGASSPTRSGAVPVQGRFRVSVLGLRAPVHARSRPVPRFRWGCRRCCTSDQPWRLCSPPARRQKLGIGRASRTRPPTHAPDDRVTRGKAEVPDVALRKVWRREAMVMNHLRRRIRVARDPGLLRTRKLDDRRGSGAILRGRSWTAGSPRLPAAHPWGSTL